MSSDSKYVYSLKCVSKSPPNEGHGLSPNSKWAFYWFENTWGSLGLRAIGGPAVTSVFTLPQKVPEQAEPFTGEF
jgi:hypothetical protein